MPYVLAERPIPPRGPAAKILSGILPAAKSREFIARPDSIDVGGIIELQRKIYTKRKLRPNQKIIPEQSGKLYRFHDAGGDAGEDDPVAETFCDYRARGDDDTVPERDAGVDRRVSAYPAVVPDRNLIPEFLAGGAFRGVQRMRCRIDADLRAEKAVVPDRDRGDVEDDAVEVRIELFADADVPAVIAAEIRFDERARAHFSEKFPENTGAVFNVRRGCRIVALRDKARLQTHLYKFRIRGEVRFAGNHLLVFGSHKRQSLQVTSSRRIQEVPAGTASDGGYPD